MYLINAFLQKSKMHESNHGFYMVVTAYALSFILLIFGSDTFYEINSKAERISTESDEATQIVREDELINPYGLVESPSYVQTATTEQVEVTADETNWQMRYAFNQEEHEAFLMNADIQGEAMAVKSGGEAIKEDTIESFSTDTVSTKEAPAVAQETMSASKNEVAMLERIVEAEASSEDMVGRILVANVIFNRMSDDEFPDTIEDVIFDKTGGEYQFSPISDKRYWSVDVTKKTKKAVQRALEGEDYSEGALYFMARKRTRNSSAKWFDNNLEWLFKHGGHEFYRNN
ncbi:MAG TPA: cell wall hydrolase [Mobilitalea sp.]|nr:cell wall hydrolase [Mobilitalea sp.]